MTTILRNEGGHPTPPPSLFSVRAAGWAFVLCLSLLVVHPLASIPALAGGWAVSALQAVLAAWVYRHVQGPHRHFMWWILGSLLARMAFLLSALMGATKIKGIDISAFASAMLISYMSLLYVELARLITRSTAWDRRGGSTLHHDI